MELVDAVYQDAVQSLRRCCHAAGVKASGRRAGHHQVWARDTMIALLGGALVDDATIRQALLASIDLLRRNQAPSGLIPNNVDAASLRPNYRAYADGGLWWILGSSILAPDGTATASILRWYDCQDVDQSGLLSMQESADWEDLFCTRGKGLYLNALYVLALQAAGPPWNTRAAAVRERINEHLWYRGDGDMLRHVRHTFSTEGVSGQDSLGRKRWLPVKRVLVNEQYYLPYLAFRAAGEWFDSLGHLLAILADIPDAAQTRTILDFIDRTGLAVPPMKSIYPHIQPGDEDWRNYYGMLNGPGQYHNGGIWPFIGGFWVATLVKLGMYDRAARELEKLAQLNRDGEFNEWHHGETGQPMGVYDQAWSAGMYIYAYHCVQQRTLLWLTSSPPRESSS